MASGYAVPQKTQTHDFSVFLETDVIRVQWGVGRRLGALDAESMRSKPPQHRPFAIGARSSTIDATNPR
jgi:hypothetical protein